MRSLIVALSILFCLSANAQDCNDSNHSVNINDSWTSCEMAPSPNPLRGTSHWVMYDLGYVYSLGATHFWNYNVQGETANGMKNIAIDLSLNGNDWTEAGSFLLSEATGNPGYEGEEGLNLGEADARYVLLTAIDTWSGDCAGLSEVKFDIEGMVSAKDIENQQNAIRIFPNPTTHSISIDTDFDSRELIITNAMGQEVARMPFARHLDISYLADGIYFLTSVNQTNESSTTKFIVQSNK